MTARKKAAPAKRQFAHVGGWLAPPRFLLFLAVFVASAGLLRGLGHSVADALDLGFDGAAVVFLVSVAPLFLHSRDSAGIRAESVRNDANRVLVLCITTLLSVVVLAAVAGEVPHVAHGGPVVLVKVIATLLLIWLFANVTYALHYAHLYYSPGASAGKDAGGLEFPGTRAPDYLDFAYFAFTLGMTFQTADVGISGRPIRHIAMLHTFAAFIYNIGVIAFTINAIGGAGGS